jgi:cellulose synthase/poly-beta-1,6-N-acetylglucosamine synthase-like glycosyltransferase
MSHTTLISPLLAFLGFANLAYVFLNLQLLKGLRKLALPAAPGAGSPPAVTILIAARNEEGRVGKCLDCLLGQDYPPEKLQIIVVNDRSEDGTAGVLEAYQARSAGKMVILSITQAAPGLSPKKNALSQGMLHATGEIILTTDADCIMSKAWVSSVVAEFTGDTGLVLGMTSYFPPNPGRPGFFWGIQALEFLSYGIVAAALVGLRFPVHGNANNIAYRRKLYDLASGFASHGRIVSGDDDFLIQSIDRLGDWKIAYSIQAQSQVQTEPPLSLRQFWEQRKRWASKCSFYQPKQVAFLGGIFAYYALILICLILGLFHLPLLYLGLASWSVKTGMDYWSMRKGAGLFSKRELLRYFPVTCLLHVPLIIAAVLAGTFGQFTWKGQTVKRRL